MSHRPNESSSIDKGAKIPWNRYLRELISIRRPIANALQDPLGKILTTCRGPEVLKKSVEYGIAFVLAS